MGDIGGRAAIRALGKHMMDGLPGSGAEPTMALEQRLRLMIESVRDYAIFLVSPSGRVESWNAGAAALKGYAAAEILGEPISRFYSEDDVASGLPFDLLRSAAEAGRVEVEGWRYRKDGSRFWADVVITAIRDGDGRLQGFSKVTRDLTERRQHEERLRTSEERFRLLVQGVRDYAIFMLDPEGRIVTWNQSAAELKGYTAHEIVGQSFEAFYGSEDRTAGKPQRLLGIARERGRVEDQGWRYRKDGTRFWAEVIITALHDEQGRLRGFAKVTRDLTERRRLDEERLRRAQAEEGLRLRDQFLSIASHELRTPLTALQLQLEALQARIDAGDRRQVQQIGRALRSSERMAELVETLLDVSRISTGRMEFQRALCNLSELVQDVAERYREVAESAGCRLLLEIEPDIVGTWDRLRIEQVVANLLSNAVKFGAGLPIALSLARIGDDAVLSLSDQGPGVPPQDLERIFGRFERAASARNYGGLGLGLYVAQEIAAGHGGTVTASNLPERGACFTVRLPLAAAGAGAREAS